MLLGKFAEQSLGLISIVLLARLLSPEDFGLVAMAMVFIAFLEIISAFGFDMALIQNQRAERQHFDTAWTCNVILGLIKALTIVAIAIPVSHIYQEPRLAFILFILALDPVIRGLENIGIVKFRKELMFDRDFYFAFTTKLSGFLVTACLALILRSYWALVIGTIFWRIAGVAISYYMHSFRPRLCLIEARELFRFSKWLLFNNFISFFYFRGADFIIGKIEGSRAVGLYSIAHEIANLPSTKLIAPINRAIFPGYASMSADLANLRAGFLKVISVIALFALPAATGIALIAEPFVVIVFGEKWIGAIPLIQILSFYGVGSALMTNTYYVHLALGNVKMFTALRCVGLLLLIPLTVGLTNYAGATGAAIAYLSVMIFLFPMSYWIIMKKLNLELLSLLKLLWKPTLASVFMFVVVYESLKYTKFLNANGIIELLGLIILGMSSYCIVLLGLWLIEGKPDGPEKFLLRNVTIILRNRLN